MKPVAGSADYEFDAANLCELEGRWAEANEHYDKAIKLTPDFMEAYDNRAGNCVELGEYANAISNYSKVFELSPHYADAHNNLAQLYLDADDPEYVNLELACSHAKQACKLTHNERYEFLATYARACHACRDYQRALRLQQRSVIVATNIVDNGQSRHGAFDRVAQIDAEMMLPELERRLAQYRQVISTLSFVQRIRSWFTRPR